MSEDNPENRNEGATDTSSAQPPAPMREGMGRRVGRMRTLVNDHPVAVLAGAAAIGVLAGAEWAVGALVGLGAGALLTGRHPREIPGELRRRWRALTSREDASAPSGG